MVIFARYLKLFLITNKMESNPKDNIINEVTSKDYEFGFVTDIETDFVPKGLNEDIIRLISKKKEEPEWLLEFRLKAYRHWLTLKQPNWGHLDLPEIDYQDIIYYAAPRKRQEKQSLDEVDPELLATFDKLGISLDEQKKLSGVAVDAVMDSTSVKTTFQETLSKHGVIFMSFSEAVKQHPDLVRKYLGKVVPYTDNFFAALNSAVFSDGSFCYIPKGVHCPLELSTYFRINAANTGQFERTLIVADEGAYVSYMEGCTAPQRDENQLHAAIVEIIAETDAEVKYSTVQNWYPGDKEGRGGVYNLVTRTLPWRPLQDLMDASGDRFGHHLEISRLCAAWRLFRGRVLLCGRYQQLPAGRYWHQDDPSGEKHEEHHHFEGHLRGT